MEKKNNTKWSSDSEIYDHTQKKVIVVNPDTLDNKLRDFEDGIYKKHDIKHFIEISLTLLGVLLTSNFRDFLGIPSNYWFAIFFLALLWNIGSFCWDYMYKFRREKYLTREDILLELMDKEKLDVIEGNSEPEESNEDKFLIREYGKSEVYEVCNGIKRHIPNGDTLIKLGYSWSEVKEVTTDEAAQYQLGEPLPSQA